MALPTSPGYGDLILGPHEQAVRITVFHGIVDVTPPGGIPVVSGTVSAALNSRVTRSLDLQVPFEFFPHNPDDILSPFKAVLQVEVGPRSPDGTTEFFPVFTGRVYEASLGGDGAVTLRADDLAADVLAFRFEQPQSSQPGISIVQQIQQLISEAVDSPTFGTNDVTDSPCPMLTWDDDRGQALDDLAAAVKGRWYTLGDGSFVVREYPYEYITGNPVDGLIYDGELFPNQPGTIITATKTITRDATANSITVISERTDGSDPIVARRRDVDSGSPTVFGGPFGKVSQILKPQTPITAAEADALAARQLSSSLALTEQWYLTINTYHYLEPGDIVFIEYRGVNSVQIIDSWTMSLTTSATMSMQTRAAFVRTASE